MKVQELTKTEFLKKVANYEASPNKWVYKGDKPCIVDFYASFFPSGISCGNSRKSRKRLSRKPANNSGVTPFEIHHVRKLKDLSGRKQWEIAMIGRKRKTMALCVYCHDKLHAGKLD